MPTDASACCFPQHSLHFSLCNLAYCRLFKASIQVATVLMAKFQVLACRLQQGRHCFLHIDSAEHCNNTFTLFFTLDIIPLSLTAALFILVCCPATKFVKLFYSLFLILCALLSFLHFLFFLLPLLLLVVFSSGAAS